MLNLHPSTTTPYLDQQASVLAIPNESNRRTEPPKFDVCAPKCFLVVTLAQRHVAASQEAPKRSPLGLPKKNSGGAPPMTALSTSTPGWTHSSDGYHRVDLRARDHKAQRTIRSGSVRCCAGAWTAASDCMA